MPFQAFGLHPALLQAIRKMHYAEPTPIQAQAIPAVLAGRDVIATAQTGTGKTAAFLLPILHQLLGLPRGMSRVLVITPTRELAQQIEIVCRDFAGHTPLRTGLLVGGTAIGPQEKILRAGADLLVATPGRLLDHMRQGQARFDRLHTLVLDEADHMFDMGFLPDLKRIIARLPGRKQTLLFSATMPPVIADLAREILRNPLSIQVGRRNAPAVGITQAAYPVAEHLKIALLRHLLRNMEMPSVLVFTRTKHLAKRLTRVLAADRFAVAELHSNRSQAQRTRAMQGFRRGEFQVLVATNIAARGLDVDHITHVISLDVPDVPDDYVHRIGRTGRAEMEGDSFIMVSPVEEKALAGIERQIGQRLPRVTLPDFDYSQAVPERVGPSRDHARGPGASKPHRPSSPAPRNNGVSRPARPGHGGGHGSHPHVPKGRRRR
jgi:ATP-dependent RNA helicase RhlE